MVRQQKVYKIIFIKFINKFLYHSISFMSIQNPSATQSSHLNGSQDEFQNLFATPSKNNAEETTDKSLMKSILKKLEGSKPNSAYKLVAKKLELQQNEKQSMKLMNSNTDESISKDMEIILSNQSPNNPGFYQYIHWVKLNAQYFSYVDRKITEEFWKLIRLVNYGQVLIPTGLIYEFFLEVKRSPKIGGFTVVINKFLKQNQTFDSFDNFRDRKNYISLDRIQKAYKGIPQVESLLQANEKPKPDLSLKKRSQSASNVFDRNFAQAKSRASKKLNNIYNGIVQECKKLSDKPIISVYKSQSYQSLIKPERICHHPEKHKSKNEEEKYIEENGAVIQNLFKAKNLDVGIFEGNIEQIPGVSTHISRNKFCQATKLKAKRQAQRPGYNRKRIY